MRFFKSKYQRLLSQAIYNPSLSAMLEVTGPSSKLQTSADVLYVVKLLKQIESGKLDGRARCAYLSCFDLVTTQLLRYGTEEAAAAFIQGALPVVIRMFDTRSESKDELEQAEAVSLLHVMSVAGDDGECRDRIIHGIRKSIAKDDETWRSIFQVIANQEEIETGYALAICEGVGTSIPDGELTVPFLKLAGDLYRAGQLAEHPINDARGGQLLDELLSGELSKNWFDIAECLPDYDGSDQLDLIQRAAVHAQPSMRLVAAKASAAIGNPGAIETLQQFCLDRLRSEIACDYLIQLGLEHAIPPKALELDFQAECDVVSWLCHPIEYGVEPDRVELTDSRDMFWPPTNDRRRLWIFKFTYELNEHENDIGMILTGSTTICLRDETSPLMSPEQIYAVHCNYELKRNDDPRINDLFGIEQASRLLAEQNNI
jgi:hypothetical protein